jgi:hypothetical protein
MGMKKLRENLSKLLASKGKDFQNLKPGWQFGDEKTPRKLKQILASKGKDFQKLTWMAIWG